MSTDYQLTHEYLVTSADVDFEQKLRFSSFTNFLIQIAWRHAEQLGWGVEELHKHNLVWVLSGLQLELDEYPKWRETITIETWPKGINRLFYLRDFLIKNNQGKVIGRATSNWILIDIEKRRPKLHQLDDEVFKANLDRHAIADLLPNLKPEGDIENTTGFTVRFSDVDINQHLTTTRYIDWMFDTYTPDQIAKTRPKGLVVNFAKEIKFDQEVNMQRLVESEKITDFRLIHSKENTIFFKARLYF